MANVIDKNLPSPTLPVFEAGDNPLYNMIQHIIVNRNLDLDLGQEVHCVFGAPVQFSMTFLPAKPLSLPSPSFPTRLFPESAVRTSSSLNGLIIATTSFIFDSSELNFSGRLDSRTGHPLQPPYFIKYSVAFSQSNPSVFQWGPGHFTAGAARTLGNRESARTILPARGPVCRYTSAT